MKRATITKFVVPSSFVRRVLDDEGSCSTR